LEAHEERIQSGSASLPVGSPPRDPSVSGVAGERRRGAEPLPPPTGADAAVAVGTSPPAAVAGLDAAAAAGVGAAQQAGAS